MKRDLLIALIAVVAVLAACLGLAKIRPDAPMSPSKPFSSDTKKEAEKKKGGAIVMHVNGEPVTEREFAAFAQGVPEQQRMMVLGSPDGRRLLAGEIVKVKVLEQEARRLGLADDPEVRTQVDFTRAQIMAGRALEELAKDQVEKNLRKAYESEKNNTIALKHVLVAYQGGQVPPRSGNAPSADQAAQKAAGIVARIRGGADFAAVAREISDDLQTANCGGSLGATRREMLPPDIAAAISKLKPGQISDPVRTAFGVHVFRVDPPSLEDLRPALMRQAQQEAVQETVGKLQKDAKVELDPKFFPQPPQPKQQQPRPPRSNS